MTEITIFRPVASQNVTVGTTSAQSTAIGAQTRFVRVTAVDTAMYIAFGANPTAAAGDIYLPVGIPELFNIATSAKIAAIAADGTSTGKKLNIVELSR